MVDFSVYYTGTNTTNSNYQTWGTATYYWEPVQVNDDKVSQDLEQRLVQDEFDV